MAVKERKQVKEGKAPCGHSGGSGRGNRDVIRVGGQCLKVVRPLAVFSDQEMRRKTPLVSTLIARDPCPPCLQRQDAAGINCSLSKANGQLRHTKGRQRKVKSHFPSDGTISLSEETVTVRKVMGKFKEQLQSRKLGERGKKLADSCAAWGFWAWQDQEPGQETPTLTVSA